MGTPETLIQIKKLSASRGSVKILHDIDLEIEKGAPFALVGESGSGKTTLLFCAAGLLPFEKGTITISGRSLTTLEARERSKLVGLVFQDYQLFPHMSVLENICLAPKLQGRTDCEAAARALLADLGIEQLALRGPHELSGGQKQRVAIARSLVLQPDVLFLDEPSAALDEATTVELAELLLRLNSRSQVIVVSHDRAFVERCCARGAKMRGGQLVAQGDIGSVF